VPLWRAELPRISLAEADPWDVSPVDTGCAISQDAADSGGRCNVHRRGTTLVGISACFLLTILTSALGAQASGTYKLYGLITAEGGDALPDAEVRFTPPDGAVRLLHTDSTGRYVFANLAAPTGKLLVRHFGFEAKTIDVSMKRADQVDTVNVELPAMAQQLNAIQTTADSILLQDPRLRAFEERAESNAFGHYVRPERIAELHPSWTSDALRGLPGVQLRPSPKLGNEVRIRGCMPLVWVDGNRMPGVELDDATHTNDVAAIEVYNSLSGVPPRYSDVSATCGTILVWLKPR